MIFKRTYNLRTSHGRFQQKIEENQEDQGNWQEY